MIIAKKFIDFKQTLLVFMNIIWIPTITQLKTSFTRPHNMLLTIPNLPPPAVPSQLDLYFNPVALSFSRKGHVLADLFRVDMMIWAAGAITHTAAKTSAN